MTLAEQMLSFFRGRSDYVAVGKGSIFEPFQLPEPPLKPEWLEARHLGGEQCLGFYLLTEDSKVYCTAVDFDNKPERPNPEWMQQAEQLYFHLCSIYLSPLVEISQSGNAAHVWLFFESPVDAWLVRSFWRAVATKLETKFVEVYPRQDRLSSAGIGNLIRYPLWGQSRFVEVESEWSMIEPAEALQGVHKTTGEDLQMLAFELGAGTLRPEVAIESQGSDGLPSRVAKLTACEWSLLGRRWRGDVSGLNDPSRSGASMSIAVELVRNYVPTPEIEAALRFWMRVNGADSKSERDDWISRTVQKAYEFIVSRQEEGSTRPTTFRDAAHAYLDMIERGQVYHIRSGIVEVDLSIDGVAPGEVCVIAARPSHGKTALAAQWCDNATSSGSNCLFVSEEMSALELGKRRILSISEVEEEKWLRHTKVVRHFIDEHHKARGSVFVVENTHSIDRLETVIDQFCQIHSVRLVAVDYAQLLTAKKADRYESVTEISLRLKQAAKRNNVAMLVLSQTSRDLEKRTTTDGYREPKLSDLRESGQLEQDADLVIFCDWPCRYNRDADPAKYLLHIAKRRNGPIRESRIETNFNPHRQTIGFTGMKPMDSGATPTGGF